MVQCLYFKMSLVLISGILSHYVFMMTLVKTGIYIVLKSLEKTSSTQGLAMTHQISRAWAWNVAHTDFAKSHLCLNSCLPCFPKATLRTWGQSRDKGEVPETVRQGPCGMPHISTSLALVQTSQECFCLGVKWDRSIGGKNVSVKIQALELGFSRTSYRKALQTFVDLLAAFLEEGCGVKKDYNKFIWKHLYLFTIVYICPFTLPFSSTSHTLSLFILGV